MKSINTPAACSRDLPGKRLLVGTSRGRIHAFDVTPQGLERHLGPRIPKGLNFRAERRSIEVTSGAHLSCGARARRFVCRVEDPS